MIARLPSLGTRVISLRSQFNAGTTAIMEDGHGMSTLEVFRYVRMNFHSPGCEFIGFELEHDQRISFPVILSLEDAERLLSELGEQIRQAKDMS